MIQILLENSLEDTWVDLCQVNVSKDTPVFTVSVKKRVKAVQAPYCSRSETRLD